MRPRTKDIFVCSTVNYKISMKAYRATLKSARQELEEAIKNGSFYYTIWGKEIPLNSIEKIIRAKNAHMTILIK